MDEEKRQRAKDIFNAALELKSDERLPFIRAKCGADGTLFTEVKSLLSYLDRAENFLERPAVEEIREGFETEKDIFENKSQSRQQIGPYTLIKKLGRGGFGEVWLAEKQTKFVTKKLAVKLPLQNQVDAEAVRHEATLWEQASGHPNVLPIIDADEYDGQIVIVSEYAPDGSLADLLKKQGCLSIEKAVEMIDGILAGLEYLHSRNIVHRDLKPDNVLLQGETPRLADFGISRVLRDTMTSSSMNLAGTPFYMSPEAFDRKRNEQTDIWSVGVIFYEILAGKRPFNEDNLINLFSTITTKEPEPLPESVPHWLVDVIRQALAKNPENRYKTASAMRQHLRHLARMPDTQQVIALPDTNPDTNDETNTREINNISTLTTLPPDQPGNKFITVGGVFVLALILFVSGIGGIIYYVQPKWIFSQNTNSNSQKQIAQNTNNANQSLTNSSTNKSQDREFRNSLGMEFVLIPAGSFMMGSEKGESDEKPIHKVTISNDFYMGKYEVTQAQWKAITGNNPSNFQGDNLPVEQVSWEDVQEFIKKLNAKGEGNYRLPTEAEWEYAARAAMTTPFGIGDGNNLSSSEANFNGNYPYGNAAKGKYLEKTVAVGSYQPNNWGLYDMHGNVWELCQDWYEGYPSGSVTDPAGATSGSYRVYRGGSWINGSGFLRSSFRLSFPSTLPIIGSGFRLIKEKVNENQNINTNELTNSSKNSNVISNTQKTPSPVDISGLYRSKIGQLKINDDSKSLSFRIGVGMPGCIGELSGKAKWISETVAEYQSKDNELYCRLTFIFNGKKVTVKENGCDETHGAMCNFEGIYTR